jgi:hypothetical protein
MELITVFGILATAAFLMAQIFRLILNIYQNGTNL